MGEHKFKKGGGQRSRSSATIIVVLIVVAVLGGLNLLQKKSGNALDKFVPERTKGSEKAPVQIVEFADFQCSHCREGSDIIREYMSNYPEGIRLTMKYYPLGQLNSSMSAYYAQCAATQGKFWEMHDQLFATQDKWRTLVRVQEFFDQLAQAAGLDGAALQQCVQQQDVRTLIAQERALGDANFIKSTPSYFINGKLVVGIKKLKEALGSHFDKPADGSM